MLVAQLADERLELRPRSWRHAEPPAERAAAGRVDRHHGAVRREPSRDRGGAHRSASTAARGGERHDPRPLANRSRKRSGDERSEDRGVGGCGDVDALRAECRERLGLFLQQAVGRIGVADAAPEAERLAVAQFPERTAAFRAAEPGRGADLGRLIHAAGVELGDLYFLLGTIRHGSRLLLHLSDQLPEL